jgi:hypothetical protein
MSILSFPYDSEYPTIQSLYKRDKKGKIIPEDYSENVFKYLRQTPWEAKEKVDGTNIRLDIRIDGNNIEYWFKGRNKESVIPKNLLMFLNSLITKEAIDEAFASNKHRDLYITIHGEGIGHNIQSNPLQLPERAFDFLVFDIHINVWWLQWSNVCDICSKLGLKVVPHFGLMTINEAEEIVEKGFRTHTEYNGNAEGIVLVGVEGILDRRGRRLITKLKTKDYVK